MTELENPVLHLRGHRLLPIVQGGMGVGISGHRLAGTVARYGAVGTLASVDLRRLYPDIMQRLRRCRDPASHGAANVEALGREIAAARVIAGPDGFIAVNVMRALSNYAELVVQACRSGANAIVSGAGLPLELPDLTASYPEVALIPILSDERGVRVVMKKWFRRGRTPDAIVLEHPRYAGGINSRERMRAAFELGANAVQIGTPFAVTVECDAHPNFKKVLAEATAADIVTFMSPAGLPARAVLTPWLKRYLQKEPRLRAAAQPDPSGITCPSQVQCLAACGFKDGNSAAGQFCLETQLAAAQRGSLDKGLFFRGSESLPFGEQIRSVAELLSHLLGEAVPAFVMA